LLLIDDDDDDAGVAGPALTTFTVDGEVVDDLFVTVEDCAHPMVDNFGK
jgi:hypothetical protein